MMIKTKWPSGKECTRVAKVNFVWKNKFVSPILTCNQH